MPFPSPGFFKNKRTLFLTHAGADVDSLSSAAALFFSLKSKKHAIGVIDHLNQSAKAFAKNMEIPFSVNPVFNGFDCIVALDFNSFEMAGTQKEKIKNFNGKVFVIDHHKKTKSPLALPKNSFVNEKAVSATEVVFNYLKNSRVKISEKTAVCIACGIITDSAGFHVADAGTFRIMAQVFEIAGKSFSELTSLFEVERDVSESIAKLKAAKRIRVFKSFDELIVFSDVGSFEASAAMAFTFLGASVAFAGDESEGKILVSGRAKNSFVRKTGFDLVEHVFVPLSKKFVGQGGGHAGAAAFNGEAKKIEPVLMECVSLSHVFLEKKFGKKGFLKEYD